MTIKAHAVQALVAAVASLPFMEPLESLVLFLSVILIDIDHYFDFVVVTGRRGIRDMFKFHAFVWENRERLYGISLFHTAEVFLLLFVLGYASRWFHIVLLGCVFHFLLDLVSLSWHGMLFKRAFSIVEYLYRRRRCGMGYPVPDEDFWKR